MMLPTGKATTSQSDPRESSVLFSLRELRQLEDERVKAEADARAAQAEAERRAKVEAEARARDEETRRVRAEEERRERAERAREARQREDRLRIEEAERRARVEGELALRKEQLLEEQRHRQMHGHPRARSAWMAAAAGVALFVAVGGGLAARAARQHDAEKKALEGEIARRGEEARAARRDFDARIRALEAQTAKDQARIPGDLQRPKPAIGGARPRPTARTTAPTRPLTPSPKTPLGVPQRPEIDDDPLGGLPAGKRAGF